MFGILRTVESDPSPNYCWRLTGEAPCACGREHADDEGWTDRDRERNKARSFRNFGWRILMASARLISLLKVVQWYRRSGGSFGETIFFRIISVRSQWWTVCFSCWQTGNLVPRFWFNISISLSKKGHNFSPESGEKNHKSLQFWNKT